MVYTRQRCPPPRDPGSHHLAHAAQTLARAPATSQPGGRFISRDVRRQGPLMKLTGAQALIKSLEMEGVEVMFGLPGGAILPVYDPIIDSPIRHILVRHEQGAGHMAEGYAHATGRPGVAMVTSGPAATNIVTPLCDAYMDSIPLVVVTGQVPYAVIGTDAFQEADTVGITMPVTKHNWLIQSAAEIPTVVREAFYVATTGRPGPVLVDIPKDVSNQTRSEEHTSELQSQSNLVCRLLLEKKKKRHSGTQTTRIAQTPAIHSHALHHLTH